MQPETHSSLFHIVSREMFPIRLKKYFNTTSTKSRLNTEKHFLSYDIRLAILQDHQMTLGAEVYHLDGKFPSGTAFARISHCMREEICLLRDLFPKSILARPVSQSFNLRPPE